MSNGQNAAAQHGDTRDTGRKTVYGESKTFTDATTGKVLYQGPMSSQTYSTGEVYCAACGGWQPYSGVMGALFARYKCPTCRAEMQADGPAAGQA